MPATNSTRSSQEVEAGEDDSDNNSNTTNSPNSSPTFSDSLSFLQRGFLKSNANFNIESNLTDTVFLRGQQVHTYISNGNTTDVQCLISNYSVNNSTLVLALRPFFFNDTTTNVREYYYSFDPSDIQQNQARCNGLGIVNRVNSDFPGTTISYQASALCPTCSIAFSSTGLEVSDTNGQDLPNVNTTNLRFLIAPANSSTDTGIGSSSCLSNNDCPSQNGCCSAGVCVTHRQIRNGVDVTSPDFLAAQILVNLDSQRAVDYPEFYHWCPTVVNEEPVDDTSVLDAQLLAQIERRELFECTTPTVGEMSICTRTFNNADELGPIFVTGADDRNFSTIYSGTLGLPDHSLYSVTYGNNDLFRNGNIIQGMSIQAGNDNLIDTQGLNITYSPASNDIHTVKVKYKVDGSCTKRNSALGLCFKVYTQGQNAGKITDHFPGSNDFKLPFYADTSKIIRVEVDGIAKAQNIDWVLINSSPAIIRFLGSTIQVADGRDVKIDYFVDSNSNNIFQAKQDAQERIEAICGCSGDNCRLREANPGLSDTDYECDYNDPEPEIPVQQTVFLSNKSVPHLYYDSQGEFYSTVDSSTPPQEGNQFEYIGNDGNRPNNVSNYVGFNEILGSFSTLSASAKPAKEVSLKLNTNYNIFVVGQRAFSQCTNCGRDYNSTLAQLFPNNFSHDGTGIFADLAQSNALEASPIRRDDFSFGRACWLPPSMIPWTHRRNSSLANQRSSRQAAQHFLFSNGYQKDWFGFNYGALIGSFDGVNWFAVGSRRRIQAKGRKLFLAFNSYFADLTTEQIYTVHVQESSLNLNTNFPVNDNDSDGATCRNQHYCETDNDCAAQLGYDYMCENVSSLKTNWPIFDVNGLEKPDGEETSSLLSLFSASAGAPSGRRCVYRAQGAACRENYDVTDENQSYANSLRWKAHACSSNTHCKTFNESGLFNSNFNNKISRFSRSITSQNASEHVAEENLDLTGKAARVLGRPYSYHGDESISLESLPNLNHNRLSAICIPGRDVEDTVLSQTNFATPLSNDYLGDLLNGIGMTSSNDNAAHSLSSCHVTDSGGNLYIVDESDPSKQSQNLSHPDLVRLAANQNISSNALQIFESNDLSGRDILRNYENEQILITSMQENRCLRAPGASCFSNLDCSVNSLVTGFTSSINPENADANALLNKYEIQFWQEELVCSQERSPGDADFDLKNNRCCREVGNSVTIGSSSDSSQLDVTTPPGVGGSTALSSSNRYSRISTIYDILDSVGSSHPPLNVAPDDACTGSGCVNTNVIENQFNTFSEMAKRTCCSSNWIREFNRESNGGGHVWSPSKMQNIDNTYFRCYNWGTCTDGDDCDLSTPWSCEHTDSPNDAKCLIRNVNLEESSVLAWLSSMELTGISQVTVKDDTFNEIRCQVDPNNQTIDASVAVDKIPLDIINSSESLAGEYEYTDGSNQYFSASDTNNFDSNIKQVFSNDTVSCCLPLGTTTNDAGACCSGYRGETGICQLPDYSNLSVYFNKNISSEADDLPANAFDSETGYIKETNISQLQALACSPNVNACESGRIALGVAISNLPVPGHENEGTTTFRFIDGNNQANNQEGLADEFDNGLRWNNQVYCYPEDSQNSSTSITIIDCN